MVQMRPIDEGGRQLAIVGATQMHGGVVEEAKIGAVLACLDAIEPVIFVKTSREREIRHAVIDPVDANNIHRNPPAPAPCSLTSIARRLPECCGEMWRV